MNRPERRMTDEDARELLKKGTYGVLSIVDGDGAPYGVPVNYVYSETENAMFFHCAKSGRKTDCIRVNGRVSFAVVGRADIDSLRFTTYYESVIVEGRASVVGEDGEKRQRLSELCEALAPAAPRRGEAIERDLSAVVIVRIDIESISGKANRCGGGNG